MSKPSNSRLKKELLILRHGKSDWDSKETDFYRPIKDRGKRNAQKMGIWLAEQHLLPDEIISSPATRALTTAEKTCKTMGLYSDMIQTDKRIYEANLSDLLQVLSEISASTQRVLLVGHNPGLEELLTYLATNVVIPDDGKLLPTATLAHLKLKHQWQSLSENDATLCSITRPKTLPESFPFPTPNGIEYRQRPAYYYSQSSVIPYRITNKELEIMLISSSSHKHWVVPKGIIEPGLSALKSAEKEALEEAGIEGTSNTTLLGRYSCNKWGALCNVDVFAMQVKRILPEAQWHESHRQRSWLSIDKAMSRINQPALRPLLKKLQQQVRECQD